MVLKVVIANRHGLPFVGGHIANYAHIALRVETQVGGIVSKFGINGCAFRLIGMHQNYLHLLVEGERLTAKLLSCGGKVECSNGEVTVTTASPTKVHVKEVVLIYTVYHPCVSATARLHAAADVHGEAVFYLLAQYLGESSCALVRLVEHGGGIIEVRFQCLGSHEGLCTAGCGTVLHVHRHAYITHEQRHSVASLRIGKCHACVVFGQHLVPLVYRLTEVHVHRAVVRAHYIRVAALSTLRPAVIIHDLCHCRSHASCVVVPRKTTVRVVLIPFRCEQRSHLLSVRGRSGNGSSCAGLSLQLVKGVTIGAQQEFKFTTCTQRVERSCVRIAQHLSHVIIACHHNETSSVAIVINIIRWCTMRSSRSMAFRKAHIDIFAGNTYRLVHCYYLAQGGNAHHRGKHNAP